MALVKGPFSLKWGQNAILDVSEVTFNYEVATNDYQTVQGDTYHTEGAMDANVEITLLASDVAALSVLFPQYFVAKGEKLSTGETVLSDDGAIDIVAASCDTENTSYDLDIISCTGDVTRLKNARTRLSAINLENNELRTVQVTFIGEAQGEACVQFLGKEDAES